jgi:hypothetical protein
MSHSLVRVLLFYMYVLCVSDVLYYWFYYLFLLSFGLCGDLCSGVRVCVHARFSLVSCYGSRLMS